MSELNHFNAKGEAHMVDISHKAASLREAVAECAVHMNKAAYEAVQAGSAQKGDVLGTARLAGIMGAKQTANLIPLCHPLPIKKVHIGFTLSQNLVHVEALVKTQGQTGVEMEALMAANIAALTIYDMLKAVDKTMTITDLRLVKKTGGKSGSFERGK